MVTQMPKLIVVAGLPGSGKSQIKEQFKDLEDRFFDDYHASATGDSPEMEAGRRYPELKAALDGGQDCLIAEPAYCWKQRRHYLTKWMRKYYPNYMIEWKFFENNVSQCVLNILHRNKTEFRGFKDLQLAANLTLQYDIPAGSEQMKVWDEPKLLSPTGA